MHEIASPAVETTFATHRVPYDLQRSRPNADRPRGVRLQRLVDGGSLSVPRDLSATQWHTLKAVFAVLCWPSASLEAGLRAVSAQASCLTQPAFEFRPGLDELEMVARTRAGYAFAELTDELQEAVLSLVFSGDLTARRIDLAVWLYRFHLIVMGRAL